MKKLFYLFVGLLFCLNMTSCQSPAQKYMREYSDFAEDFLFSYGTYNSMDWEAAVAEYAALRDQYSLYRSDLSKEDRDYINEVNTKINAAFIRYEGENAVSEIESLLKETVGTLNELFSY